MSALSDLWFAKLRREELLREATLERLARGLRRARTSRAGDGPARTARAVGEGRPTVRPGTIADAPRIADLLELNGMPRWVAFEERFLIAEAGGEIVGVLRFREDPERLHLGLLVADPWAGEHSLAVELYAGARELARELGLREVRAKSSRHGTHLREAGYRRWRGGWRLEVPGANR